MGGKMKALLLALVLALSMLAAGCDSTQAPDAPGQAADIAKQQTAPDKAPASNETHLTVYYPTADAMYLVPEVWTVPKTAHPAKDAMDLLLRTPNSSGLVKIFPEGTVVKSVTIKDHTAYVDFNDKIVKNNTGGSTSEMLMVVSVVNTLTEFTDIHKVQIMVEGKKVETLSGHVDVSVPLSRSEQIIKKSL